MSNQTTLDEFAARGIGIEAAGARLLIHAAPGRLTDQDRAELRRRKRELLAALEMPSRADLVRTCRRAAAGLPVDPERLADWLIRQRDPGWCHPKAAARWAQYATDHGSLPE